MASSIQKAFMSEFDPIAYLNSRFQESLPVPPAADPTLPEVPNTQGKTSELMAARQAKMERLNAWREKRQQAEAAKQKSYDNSVIGILGMDPNGLAATALNTAVGVGSGLTNIAANIGSSIHAVDAAAQTHGIPEEARAAYGRWKQGAATEADMALLNGVNAGNGRRPGVADAQRKATNYGETNFQRLQQVEKSLDNAQAIRDIQKEMFADRVYRGDQQAFESQLMEQGAGDLEKTTNAVTKLKNGEYASGSLDLVSGLAGLFANVGATALDNPKAALGYIAENAAQLALASGGSAGMALTNLPYAMDAFGQGIEAYRKKNNGALPSNEQMLEMAGKAASLAVAETVGDKLTLGADKLTSAVSKGIKGAADLATKPISKEGLKNALKSALNLATDSAPSRIAQNTVTGALGEFATEGYQTAMEENIKGNDASAEDIYKGAAAGALAGGGIAGGLNTVSEAARMVGAAAKRVEEKNAQQDAMENAVKTGDTTAFTDPNSPTFAPHKALQALIAHGTQEGATAETRKANLEKATAMLEQFQKARDTAKTDYDTVSPETRKQDEATLAQYKAMLGQTTDPDMKAMLTDAIQITEQQLASTTADEATIKAKQDALAKATKDFTEAQALHTELSSLVKHDETVATSEDTAKLKKYADVVKMTPEELDTHVKLADSAVDATNLEAVKASSQAAEKVISLAMASPNSVSVAQAKQLAGNMSNGLTPAQRNYLRAFSEARIARNLIMTPADVQNDVMNGSTKDNQKGIATYDAEMSQAVATGNKAKAQSSLTGITRFAQDHASKLAAANKAMDLFKKTGVAQQIYSNGKREWSVADTALPEAERRSKGGLEIDGRSQKLVTRLQQEVHALNKAAEAHQAAFDMAFKGEKPTKAEVPVARETQGNSKSTQVSQETSATSVNSQKKEVDLSNNQQTEVNSSHFKGPESTTAPEVSEQSTSTNTSKTPEASQSTEVNSSSLKEVQTQFPALALREASAAEVARLNQARTRLKAFAAEFKTTRIFISDAPGFVGHAFPGKGTILLSSGLFKEGSEAAQHPALPADLSVQDRVALVLAHEAAHIRDGKNARVVDGRYVWRSENSRTLQFGGDIHKEVAQALSKASKQKGAQKAANILNRMFGYIYETAADKKLVAHELTRELFAQLHATTSIFPEITHEYFPNTHQVFTRNGQNDQGGTAATESVSDGRGSGGSGQQSVAESTSGTERPEGQQGSVLNEEAVDGKLTVYSQEDDTAKPYNLRNLLHFFKQSSGGDTAATQRPLVKVKDFLSRLIAGTEFLDTHLEAKPDEAQQKLIDLFKQHAKAWLPELQDNFARPTEKGIPYRYQDMASFFVNEDGSVDENVLAAIAYGTFAWLAEDASKGKQNYPEDINRILGRDEDHEVSGFERKHLGQVGLRRSMIINSIGQKASQALGMKALPDASKDLAPRLEAALGAHGVALLLNLGLVTQNTLSKPVMDSLYGSRSKVESGVDSHFLRPAYNARNELDPQLEEIKTAMKDSRGVLDHLFGAEPSLVDPSQEAIPFTQKTTRNTSQGIPGMLRKILTRQNAQENFIHEAKWSVISQMSPEAVLSMMGEENAEEGVVHAARKDSVEAANEGLKRDYERFMAYVKGTLLTSEKGLKTALFFPHNVWKQQRVGIASNTVNPQTSKFHRFMLFKNAWVSEVSLEDAKALEHFKLRVMEGLGVKTDKKSNADNLPLFDAFFNPNHTRNTDAKDARNAAIRQAAVESLVAVALKGEAMTADHQEAIRNGVEVSGENMHSFDALMAMAEYVHAQETGSKTFTTRLMGEIDGVTNGPMLSHLLLGAASTAEELMQTLNRGGFFQRMKDSVVSQYNVWRGQGGNLDLYESTTQLVLTHAKKLMNPDFSKVKKEDRLRVERQAIRTTNSMVAIQAITGTLEDGDSITKSGRDIIKTPLTAMMFGSSVSRAVTNMAEKLVDQFYAKIEKAHQKRESATDVVKAINTLIESGDYTLPRLNENASTAELMKTELTQAQRDAVIKAFKYSLGTAVQSAMEERFATFLQRRAAFNNAATSVFHVYNATYEAERQAFAQKLVQEGTLETDSKGNPLRDLTSMEEAEFRKRIQDVLPNFRTFLSLKDKSENAGLFVSKSARRIDNANPVYASVNKFAKPVKGTTGGKGENGEAKSMKTRGYQIINSEPGVGMLPMSIHSSDSAISHMAAFMGEVLNVHDAHGSGLKDFLQSGKNLNQATWKVMLGYSPLSEMLKTYQQVLEASHARLENPGFKEAYLPLLQAALKGEADRRNERNKLSPIPVSPTTLLSEDLITLANAAYEGNQVKFGVLSQLAYVDQYALEGGHYEVTDADRKEAQDQLDAVKDEMRNEAYLAADDLGTALGSWGDKAAEVVSQDDEANPDQGDVVPTMTPLGPVLQSKNPVNEDVAEAFAQKKSLSAREALKVLASIYTQTKTPYNVFARELLGVLAKRLPADLQVQMVYPNTPVEDIKGGLGENDYAAFNFGEKSGKGTIYIRSSAFVNSNVQPETLLHELVHAAVAFAIQQAEQATDKSSTEMRQMKKLVTELSGLLDTARDFVQQMPEAEQAQFKEATKNVQEFVAWGMTNKDFQDKVLKQVQYKSVTRSTVSRFVDGFKAFVANLVGILFQGSNLTEAEQKNAGLTVFLENTTKLIKLAPAAQAQEGEEATQSLAMASSDPRKDYSTHDIFDALASNTEPTGLAQERALRSLLGSIVEKLHGPMGSFKADLMKDQALTAQDVFAKAIATGKAPFASQLVGAPFSLNAQERFVAEQVEATVRAALSDTSQTTAAYSALSRLYKEAYSRLQPKDFHSGDWDQASQADIDAANEKRDFLFKLDPDASQRSNHLARFAALALVNPGLREKLGFSLNVQQKASNTGIYGRLEQLFQTILTWFSNKITKSYNGQQANERLLSLVDQLVDIEAGRRDRLAKEKAWSGLTSPIDKTVKSVAESVRQKVVDIGTSKFFKERKNNFVRAAGSVSAAIAGDRVPMILDAINEIRNEHFKGEQQGFLTSLLNDVRGPKALFEGMLRLTKHNETLRKEAIEDTAKLTLTMFKDEGKNLTKEAKHAITQVFLRTGAHVLLADFSMQDVAGLLSDPAQLEQAIASYETTLAASQYAAYYSTQSKTLGYYLATGKTRGPLLMLNAGNIARLSGTRHVGAVSEREAQRMEQTIDVLTTLYALQYSKGSQRHLAHQALLDELNRADNQGNGVEGLLRLHQNLEQESRDRLFAGNEALMQKAYVPEIVNPHVELRMVTLAEGKALELQGFTLVHAMGRDKADTVQEGSVLYARHGGGQMPWQTGIMSYTGMASKGTEALNQQMLGSNTAAISTNKSPDIDALFKRNPRFDPSKVKGGHLVPVMNADGHVASWRYLMEGDTRDNVLERDSRFDQVMGKLAGSILDKETTQAHNSNVVKALLEEYRAEAPRKMDQYLLVGEDSTDPQLQQIYRMLPEATRREIEDTWGMKGMRVKAEMLDLVFGYRKLSLSTMFDKDAADKNPVEKIFTGFVESLMEFIGAQKYPGEPQKAKAYAKRASMMVRKGERAWQEIVREVKDVIVIRTGTVLLGNVISNISLLWAQGVPLADMARHHAVAYKAATDYMRDRDELSQLKKQVEIGHLLGDAKATERRITELEDALARNPVKALIDAGMMPSIVEDVTTDEDPYSYKSLLKEKTEQYTDKINPTVLNVVRHVTLSRGTPVYNWMHKQTQLSDFVARYTLYQHLTTRKENPLSKNDALHRASEAFINYDIPMHRALQYIDDMGLVMFNKYALRIQRVILQTVRENPSRALALLLMQSMIVGIPTVMDASVIHHIGNNPFSSGALQLPFLMDDLLTSKLGAGLLK